MRNGFAVILLAALCVSSHAQNVPPARETLMSGTAVLATCPGSREKFEEPKRHFADDRGVLHLRLDIKQFTKEVPVWTSAGCSLQPFNLRMYAVLPQPRVYEFPGPTLVLRKPTAKTPGDRLVIDLSNHLPPSSEECAQGSECDCTQTPKPRCCQACDCAVNPTAQCCSQKMIGKLPNCFHGDNTTNLHFHGLHVSPQRPQDWVFLELQPAGTEPGGHSSHGALGQPVVESFQYDVNPLPPNQSEGTHWYHPHKHGSTALQVGNGMAGALLVDGPFDEWLNNFYGAGLQDKVMVVQQVHDLNFMTKSTVFAPVPLINGKLQPVVEMRVGEVQRWRFISATMEASAQLTIDFDSPAGTSKTPANTKVTVRQIAMDGIPLSPKNYACQPLLDPRPCTGYREPQELRFRLSPGNRADFLVKAPATPGDYALTYSVFGAVDAQGRDMRPGVSAAGRPVQEEKARELVSRILEDVAPGPAEPAILLVRVKPCVDCEPMEFPKEVPPLPSYLRPIPDSKNVQTVQFRLNATAPGTEPEQPGAQTTQPQFFGLAVKEQNGGKFIQFNPNCANFTEPLERVETWTLSQNLNNTGALPFHVFHIHTNPFQVVRFGTQTYPEPIWMDSVTLPSIAKAQNGFPTDEASTVVIRQRFEDYTGPYVFHCHFLGHEDRGMMLMVQTTCRNAPGHYGVPDPDGGPDDCAICVTNPEKCLTALAPCFANARTRQQKK